MTTTVTVSAHCDQNTTEVIVAIAQPDAELEVTTMQDGDTVDFHVYGEREITVKEVQKSNDPGTK